MARQGGGGLGQCAELGRFAQVIHDIRQAFRHDLRADIVEDHTRDAVPRHGGQHERDKTTARGAEDRDAVQAQMIEERHHIARFDRHLVAGRIAPVGSAAPAKIHADDLRAMGKGLTDRLEILHVAGQPRQAQKGRALPRDIIGKPQAIGAGNICHLKAPIVRPRRSDRAQ